MGFKSTKTNVEKVVFNGYTYNRYPDSPRRTHRVYFARSGAFLHREVWVFHNGEIPKGHHIHHKNGDTGDNRIENLECLPSKQHHAHHAPDRRVWGRAPEQLGHLERIRPLSASWHSSPEGLEWHRHHAKNSIAKADMRAWWGSRPLVEKVCAVCGGRFAKRNPRSSICSQSCHDRKRREAVRTQKLGTPKVCEGCGAEFATVYRSKKYCSTKCKCKINMQKYKARRSV